MRSLFIYILLPVALCADKRIWAQQAPYSIPGYSVAHYTDENGLPQNSVKDINIDQSGYIWLATEAGLVRYDGKNFRLLSKKETGVQHPRIELMGRSPIDGLLYTFSEEGGQAAWNENRSTSVFRPLPDWASTASLTRWYGGPLTSTLRLSIFTISPTMSHHLLLNATRDSFYILAPDRVVYRTAQKIIWETGIRPHTGGICFLQDKQLYVCFPEGQIMKITAGGMKEALRIPRFKKIIPNPGENQNFVITYDNKLYELEKTHTGQLRAVLLLEGFPPDFEISAMAQVEKNTLFIGSNMQGLLVCKKHQFKVLASDLLQLRSIFYGVYPLDENTVLTSFNDRVSLHGDIKITVPPTPLRLYNRSLTVTRNGKILICQNDSVPVYSPENRHIKTLLFGSLVTAIYTDRRNRTWVAAVDEHMWLLDENLDRKKNFVFPDPEYVNYIFELADNEFLVGTRNGLYRFSESNSRILPYPQTLGMNVRNIFRSNTGRIYLCTYGDGLVMLTPSGLIHLPLDNAGYLTTAHCMLQDAKGRLWITTNKGLFYTYERDFIQYAEGKISRVYYHYINKSSGFKTNEFNGGCQPCGAQFASGELVFPSMNGLVTFHPDSVVTWQPTKKMAIEKVVVDDRTLEQPGDTITVKRNFNRLEIYLTTPFYGVLENLMYEYTFDSTLADSWVPIGTANRSLAFTSLPPGYSYICFRQKTRIGLGNFNYQTLVLYKPKAIWELAYFWLFCLVLLALGVFLVIRLRTRALKQRNRKLAEAVDEANRELLLTIGKLEKKTRFQQWLTSSVIHDLRGPLRFINFYAGDIQREGDETSPAQNKFLKSVYFSALKIYNYTDNLVQLLRMEQVNDFPPQKTDFMELVEDKIDQFREQAEWNHITLQPDPDSDPFIYVNGPALSIILQNLLDNAIKNVRHGHIYISLKSTEHRSVIEISDEGPGMSPELLEKLNRDGFVEAGSQSGMGLRLIKSLMAQTGGSIRFENLPEKGLKVLLSWEIPQEGKR